MCTGRVNLGFVFEALSEGMDGVFIIGCRLGECNYLTQGNYDALNMSRLCKKIMEHIGLDPERLRIQFMSSGEGNVFAEAMNDFTKKIHELGPLGKAEGLDEQELKSRLATVTRLVPYIKTTEKAKLALHLNEAEYDTLYHTEEIAKLLDEVIAYYIDPGKCQACMICARRCPVKAIEGGKNRVHVIDQEKCIKCGTCLDVCPSRFSAVKKVLAEHVPAPVPESARTVVRVGNKTWT